MANFGLFEFLSGYKMNKAIITAVGRDGVGIIARICTCISDHNVGILDISQTIVQGYFNMMMIVDTTNLDMDFAAFTRTLSELADSLGIEIRCQRSDIFDKMHRI